MITLNNHDFDYKFEWNIYWFLCHVEPGNLHVKYKDFCFHRYEGYTNTLQILRLGKLISQRLETQYHHHLHLIATTEL